MVSAIVTDSSAVTGLLFVSQRTDYTVALKPVLQQMDIIVPSLFLYEMTNVMLMQTKRHQLSHTVLHEFLDRIRAFPTLIVDMRNIDSIAKLSQAYSLTAYDAAYLALALEEHAPLATQDVGLKNAAIAEKLFYNPVP